MTTKIVCITPNAAIDRTLIVPGYARGGIFRPTQMLAAPGGKGINVARTVTRLGGLSFCAGFLAGHSGRFVADVAEQEGMGSRWTFLQSGDTRTCTIIVDPDSGQLTIINEPGMTVTAEDWQRLREDVYALSDDADCICWCGSLPPGSMPEMLVDGLITLVTAGKTVFVDTSGDTLRAAAQVRGVSIKVNDDEAGEMTGTPVKTREDALDAASKLSASCGGDVVITRGSQGAVMVTKSGETASAVPPELKVTSAVGSGDAFLGALVLAMAQKQSPQEALKQAVATGAANALTIGGGSFDLATVREIYDRVVLTR